MTQSTKQEKRRNLEKEIYKRMRMEQATFISGVRKLLPELAETLADSELNFLFRMMTKRDSILALFQEPTPLPMKELKKLSASDFPLLTLYMTTDYEMYLFSRNKGDN